MSSSWLGHLKTKFASLDAAAQQQLETILFGFEAAMDANKPKDMPDDHYRLKVHRAINHALHNLTVDSTGKKVLYRLEARDLDFTMGDNVYSTTPRLLLRVPVARETAEVSVVNAVTNAISFETVTAKTNENTVLIVPNQEGEQEKLEDRPVVQYSALAAGEYVIFGGLKLANRKAVYDIVAGVMNPPEGRNAFHYFDEAGTVENLADILRGIQKLGFGNMYNVDEGYRINNVQPLPAYEGAIPVESFSGFYEKPANAIMNSAVFLPGPVLFIGRGRSEEMLPENGYALFEKVVGQEAYDIKPLSPGYIRDNFVYRLTRGNVVEKAVGQQSSIMFVPDHPLRDFTREFEAFQYNLAAFNKGLSVKAAPNFNAKAG